MKDLLRACCAAAAGIALSLPAAATTLSFDELSAPLGSVFGSSDLPGVYQGFDLSAVSDVGWQLADPLGGATGITLHRGPDAAPGDWVSASIRGSNAFTFTSAAFSVTTLGTPSDIWIELLTTDGSRIWLGGTSGLGDFPTLSLTGSGDTPMGVMGTYLNPLPATEIAQMLIYGRPGSFVVDDIALIYPYGSGSFGGGTGGGGTEDSGSGAGSGTGGSGSTDPGSLPLGDGSLVTPIPEPSTYAMLLAGLGCIALVARRRQMQS